MTSEAGPALTERQESLRDGLTARLSRLGTFAVSVVVLLVVLLVVIEQQIREYEREINDAASARTHAGMKLAASLHALKSLRHSFFSLIPRRKLTKRPDEMLLNRQAMELALDKAEADAREAITSSVELAGPKGSPGQALVMPSDDSNVEDAEASSKEALPANDESLYEQVLSTYFLADGQSWDKKLVTFQKAEEQLRKSAKLAEYSTRPMDFGKAPQLAHAHTILRAYEVKVHTVTLQRANVTSAAERIRKVHATKESIPTPFGSFQIDPRLALLGIAFASLLAYIFFNLSARSARRMASEFADSLSAEERCNHAVVTPVWFVADSNSVREMSVEPADWKTAAGVHGAWLLLALVICVESVRWNTAHSLLISRWYSTYATLAAAAVFAGLLAVDFVRPGLIDSQRERLPLPRLMPVRMNRRKALSLLGIGAIAVIGAAVFRKWHRKGRPLTDRLRTEEAAVPLYVYAPLPIDDEGNVFHEKPHKWSWNLTAHSRTAVVHHVVVCAHHLPKPSHRVPAPTGGVVHHGWEASILYQASLEIGYLNQLTLERFRERAYAGQFRPLRTRTGEQTPRLFTDRELYRQASEAAHQCADELRAEHQSFKQNLWKNFESSPLGEVNRGRMESIIKLLVRAIELKPWSYHLHHRLIRIYGQLGRYDDIKNLIERSQKLAAEGVKVSPKAEDIAKAKREFDAWPAKLERRRVASAKKKLERQQQQRSLVPSKARESA